MSEDKKCHLCGVVNGHHRLCNLARKKTTVDDVKKRDAQSRVNALEGENVASFKLSEKKEDK